MKIVVVDDNRDMRRFLTRIFEDHEVIAYASADGLFEASLWEGVGATIVDLDLGRGRQTGIDLLTWLTAQGLGGRRVVFSGFGPHLGQGLRSVSDEVLVKPAPLRAIRQAALGD